MTEILIQLPPQEAAQDDILKREIARTMNISAEHISHFVITRKSIDARRGKVLVNIGIRVFVDNEQIDEPEPQFNYLDVRGKKAVIIVGAGPAGLFAALRLLELGLKPIIIERGRMVGDRKRDIAQLNQNLNLNTESNYAFGEGGAGTFSDGKLYTRSKKRGDNKKILQVFCKHGADKSILYEAHPHIGTNKLPAIIESIRQTIMEFGGEILFESKVCNILHEAGCVTGVQLHDGQIIKSEAVILAAGHSAKDVYSMLVAQGIKVEAKSFAVGVRVEHPQSLIDSIQYHGIDRGDFLPAAEYSLVNQVDGRGVYSFCMCPGGFIVPAATSKSEVVVNGMSPSRRNSPYANSGIVVEVRIDDLQEYAQHGELAGLEFQRNLEGLAYKNGAVGVVAPAQRLADFVASRHSSSLPKCSYNPGLVSSDLHRWLPSIVGARLQQGFSLFDKKMHGFLTNQAVILGVESRTSSPVRIPRNPETMQHVALTGLFPAGEGAGYSGGIVSSALDGDRSADAAFRLLMQP